MKHNLKRVVLALCMTVGVLSLSACGSKAEEAQAVDPQIASYVTQFAEGIFQEITSLSEEQAKLLETDLLDSGEDGLASAVNAWTGSMDDTGAFVEILSTEVSLDDEGQYVTTTTAQFAERKAEFKLFCEIDRQTGYPMPTSASMSPEYTFGENMAKAAMNTLLGMGTVFIVLIFISLLIGCFKFINVFEQKMKGPKAEAPAPAPTPAAAPVQAAEPEVDLTDDLELVAVITAAIAAASETPAEGLVVRSIRRASGAKWKRA